MVLARHSLPDAIICRMSITFVLPQAHAQGNGRLSGAQARRQSADRLPPGIPSGGEQLASLLSC